MKIFDAVNLICGIDREWDSVQAFPANNARETLRMIWFASRPQDPLENRFLTNGTFLKRVQVIFFAKRLSFKRVKRFSLQINLTFMASEARDVINILHGCTSRRFADNTFAFCTDSVIIRLGICLVHWLNQQVGERVNFWFLVGRQTLHGRAVAAQTINIRCVKWIVWAWRHLRRWTGIDGLVDWLISRWVLRRRSVNSVVVRISLIFHLIHLIDLIHLMMMMIGRHVSDVKLVVYGRRQNCRRITVWAAIAVGRSTQFTVRWTDGAGRRRKFFVILFMFSVDVERWRWWDDVWVNQLVRLINLILTKILVELHFLPVRIKVLIELHNLLSMFQRFFLQLQFNSIVKCRLAKLSFVLRVCINVRIVRWCAD